MRLLLDEHLAPRIAVQLRKRNHDVLAVAERADLRSLSDEAHFAWAPEERRAIVTRDFRRFRPLVIAAARAGIVTYGLVCVPRARFGTHTKDIGRIVKALDGLLKANPADDAAVRAGGEIWLREPGG